MTFNPGSQVKGHPSVQAHRGLLPPLEITICAECESVSSVLFLSTDRWFCTKCRNDGDARPTQIAVTNPNRKR